MKKISAAGACLWMVMFASTAMAQTKPFRADGGIQAATQSGWTGGNGVPGLYYKVSSGWWVRKPDNTEIGPLGTGGGGSSTLTLTYANGAATTDSLLSLDSTRGPLVLQDNATPIGTLFKIQSSGATAYYTFDASNLTFGANRGATTTAGNASFNFGNATGTFSTSTGTNTFNGNISLTSGKTVTYAGGASTFDASASSGVFKTTTGAHTFGSASWAVPANLVVTGGSSATNTSGISHVANVADGASSIAHDFNNATSLANATASLFTLRNNGTKLLNTRLSSADGVKFVDGGGSSALALSTTLGSILSYGSAQVSVGSSTATLGDGVGSFAFASGNVTATVFQMVPDADGTRDFGLVGTRWRTVAGKRVMTGSQTMSFSATPAFDCTAGNHINIGTITANVTGPTMVAGSAGEECTITFLKDGTAGAFTIAGWASNVRFNGTMTMTTGAGSLATITFWWDDRLSTPAWVEKSRAIFN